MKNLIYSLGFLTILAMVSCEGKPQRPDSVLNESQQNYSGNDLSTTTATPPTTPPAEPAQNAEGVWHYTCNNGCAGGAGSAVACASCGSTLAHNQAYHSGANTPTPPKVIPQAKPGEVTPGSKITFDPSNPGSATTTSPGNVTIPPPTSLPKTPEPAQNASGVWHYTCSNGCAGGAGSAAACGSCGTTLVHNQAYHNK